MPQTLLIPLELTGEGAQSTLFYCFTQTPHKLLIEVQIVNRIELGAQYFLTLVQVVQVGTTKFLACITAALFIKGTGVPAVAGIAQPEQTMGREEMGITSVSCGHNAVEHIDTMHHRMDNIFRSANSHEVTGFIRWHPSGCVNDYISHFNFWLPDR